MWASEAQNFDFVIDELCDVFVAEAIEKLGDGDTGEASMNWIAILMNISVIRLTSAQLSRRRRRE